MSKARWLTMIVLVGMMLCVMWLADVYVRATAAPATRGAVVDTATPFLPSRNGFPYINHAGAEKNSLVGRLLPGICGGMSYASLDFYAAKAAPPSAGGDSFVLLRDIGSVVGNAASFVIWTLAPDTAPTTSSLGLATSTRSVQIPDLSRRLARGPVPIGLVKADSLAQVAKNHQVVAYALEVHGSLVTVRIYDPNHPGCDETILSVNLADNGHATQYCRGRAVDSWRGFFLEDYVPFKPPNS